MKEIRSLEELEKIIDISETKPVILFKHSATCPISRWAYNQVEKGIEDGILPNDDVYMIVVQHSRPLSDDIASRFKVRHESPQVLVISNHQCVYHESHYGIHIATIREVLENHASTKKETS